MASRITVLVIDAVQPRRVADFWAAALDLRIVEEEDGGISLAAPDDAWPVIDVIPVPEAKTAKNRLHLDLRADGSSREEEISRLLALGATRAHVGQPADVNWTVLADPEGNEFCVLSRTVQEVQAPPKAP